MGPTDEPPPLFPPSASYIYIYIYMSMCIEREREREEWQSRAPATANFTDIPLSGLYWKMENGFGN
jgi:hypothetical protein